MSVTKKLAKYNSYKLAFKRINLALETDFQLKAIAIEESIMTDRLFPFLNGTTFKDKPVMPQKMTDSIQYFSHIFRHSPKSEELRPLA